MSWLGPSPQIPVFFKTRTPYCPVPWWDSKWSNGSPPHTTFASSDAMKKKVGEKVGKIPWICNNHRRDLYCNMAGPKKRVHLWNTSKCSLPFSPGERDTTTWRCHFLSAKVLIKIRVKVLPKDCSSLYIDDRASTQIIWPMLLTEQNKFHSM